MESAPASKRARKEEGKTRKTEEEGEGNEGGVAPLIVFSHGAGAPSSSEWMQRWKNLLAAATNAVQVVTFDYPYCAGGKKGAPPKAEKLIDPHLEQIKKAQSKYLGHPLVLVGKSMGSRVSCMVASSGKAEVAAIICLGYPLKGTSGAIRDQTLLDLHVPVMFVQGSKDSLCPLSKLQEVQKKMDCVTKLHSIEGGDHSFKVGKKAMKDGGTSQEEIEHEAVDSIQNFLTQVLGDAKKG